MMLDLLVALAMMMSMVVFLLPQTISIIQERKNIRLAEEASSVLRESILYHTFHAAPIVTEKSERIYLVSWTKAANKEGYDACVTWEDARQASQKKCRYVAI